jgi:hypothetical protein
MMGCIAITIFMIWYIGSYSHDRAIDQEYWYTVIYLWPSTPSYEQFLDRWSASDSYQDVRLIDDAKPQEERRELLIEPEASRSEPLQRFPFKL